MSIPEKLEETQFFSILESEGDSTMHTTRDTSMASIARPTMTTLADVHSPPSQPLRHSTPIPRIHGIRPLRSRSEGRNSLRREPQFSTIAEMEQSRLQDETLDAEIANEILYRQRLATPRPDPLMTSSGYMMPNITGSGYATRPESPTMDNQLMLRQNFMEQERIREAEELRQLQLNQVETPAWNAQIHPILGFLQGCMRNALGSNRVDQMPMPMVQPPGQTWTSTTHSPALGFSPNISPNLTYAPVNINYNGTVPLEWGGRGGGGRSGTPYADRSNARRLQSG